MNDRIYEQTATVKKDFRAFRRLENEKPPVTVRAVQDPAGLRALHEKHIRDPRFGNRLMIGADPEVMWFKSLSRNRLVPESCGSGVFSCVIESGTGDFRGYSVRRDTFAAEPSDITVNGACSKSRQ